MADEIGIADRRPRGFQAWTLSPRLPCFCAGVSAGAGTATATAIDTGPVMSPLSGSGARLSGVVERREIRFRPAALRGLNERTAPSDPAGAPVAGVIARASGNIVIRLESIRDRVIRVRRRGHRNRRDRRQTADVDDHGSVALMPHSLRSAVSARHRRRLLEVVRWVEHHEQLAAASPTGTAGAASTSRSSRSVVGPATTIGSSRSPGSRWSARGPASPTDSCPASAHR